MKNSGFTLVELLIVITIMAIIATLALPSYQTSVRKARRADAQNDLMEFAGNAERVFTQNSSYASLALDSDGTPLVSETDFYTYTLTKSALAYTITAAPKSVQAADDCGTMGLNQAGHKTYNGSQAGCWQ